MVDTGKLVAILAADVVGYRRLAGSDEDRTLARLRALRSDLIDPTIAVHNGRVVKRTGDGSIVEFRSVVDAVRCAIEVQNSMVERNARLPPERRLFPKVQRASCRARRTVLLIRSDRSVAPFGGLSARTVDLRNASIKLVRQDRQRSEGDAFLVAVPRPLPVSPRHRSSGSTSP